MDPSTGGYMDFLLSDWVDYDESATDNVPSQGVSSTTVPLSSQSSAYAAESPWQDRDSAESYSGYIDTGSSLGPTNSSSSFGTNANQQPYGSFGGWSTESELDSAFSGLVSTEYSNSTCKL